ncbi:hypothetical protein KC19_2G108700 [Ceratodon purpureus]|uniref:Uncharacterized protein n=1 Tax=Ceratodon purpureus TaxID=3225 RepID=A0A8T0ISI7_CERPU|nr:hypothetical protein KC19_2G108700 [Ceratodon purpureus]
MKVLTGLSNLTGLLTLRIFNCNLKDMFCVGGLSTLQKLHIIACEEMERLPNIHRLTRLESLIIFGCPRLRIWEGLRELSLLIDNHRLLYEGSSAFPALIEVLKCDGLPITELPDERSFPHFKYLHFNSL